MSLEKDEVAKKIKDLFTSEFGVPGADIKPESKLYADLGLDSIDAVDMVVKLEMETGLKLKAPELRSIRTFQDVVDVVHDRLLIKDGK
jgi:acyl carrier protein